MSRIGTTMPKEYAVGNYRFMSALCNAIQETIEKLLFK